MDILGRLVENGTLTDADVQRIGARIDEESLSYEQALLEDGVDEAMVRKMLAEEFRVEPFVLEEGKSIEQAVLEYIPEESARHYRIMPLAIEDGVLVIGVNDPDNLQVQEVLNFISNKNNLPYKLAFLLDKDIEKYLTFYESLRGEVDEALISLDHKFDGEAVAQNEAAIPDKQDDLSYIKEDAPVTKIVATILRYAVDGSASDIHIEPTGEKVMVRFRVDGSLSKSLELPQNVQSAVVARVKILSSIRLDEKRKPQDGRFSANFDGRKIDFRVSVLPTNHGEKVVMRILDNVKGINTLEETGISDKHLQTIRRMLKEPYGIILISGPTGSGKSTTLYAMLSEVDRVTKNVLSLEDPIEYNIPGVSQSQVRPEIGYNFATGLRSALRQDPDVIMVGEIRDKETAQLAIQAALTGHLVLSTIHTNNSIGVVPRLIDMGVDPYLIAPTLKLAIAQRLARRLCPEGGKEVPVDTAMRMMFNNTFKSLPEKYVPKIADDATVVHPEATPGCATGTKGRVAVMEVLEVNNEIQDLILKGGSEEEMFMSARKHGFMSMEEDAIIKALKHSIPVEEVSNFGTKVGGELLLDDMDIPSVKANVDSQSLEEDKKPVDNPEQTEGTDEV
jgi:type IV pilus assembly protein PilB